MSLGHAILSVQPRIAREPLLVWVGEGRYGWDAGAARRPAGSCPRTFAERYGEVKDRLEAAW